MVYFEFMRRLFESRDRACSYKGLVHSLAPLHDKRCEI
jgi:hypothetical protein